MRDVTERLEYLRTQIRAEQISYGEIAELQGLAEHIEPSDVELLQWAGVPEFHEDDDGNVVCTPEVRCYECRLAGRN